MRDASLAIELNARGQAKKGHMLTTVYANMWKPSQFCRAEAKKKYSPTHSCDKGMDGWAAAHWYDFATAFYSGG